MSLADELFDLANGFEELAKYGDSSEFKEPMKARAAVIENVAKAHSGSWLGYHARIYQTNLQPVLGAHFDAQWGFDEYSLGNHRGKWAEFDPEGVKAHIVQRSGNVDFTPIKKKVRELETRYVGLKSAALSILSTYMAGRDDSYVGKIKYTIENLGPISANEIIAYYRPKNAASADRRAINAGFVTPPHIELAAELNSLTVIFDTSAQMIQAVRQAASHIERQVKTMKTQERIGTNVFIGHGRSPLWRELKDFVQDRVNLPADEFNRVPVAGMTNIARLSQMLDASAIAFLIMTAEDETSEGKTQARMNVIHEVGLFQGRLGFSRAIIMLEEGCEEFSNVQGLGQIRFPRGNIRAVFEEVREVLEREGLAG